MVVVYDDPVSRYRGNALAHKYQMRLSELFEAQSNQTLYHGTSIEALKSIRVNGLEPQVGHFTRTAYDIVDDTPDEDEDHYCVSRDAIPDLVFAADRNGVSRCYSAMIHAISLVTGKRDHTAESIAQYGALLLIKNQADDFSYRHNDDDDDDGYEEHPETVEPGDYYSEQYVEISGVITGKRLVQWLTRHGVTFGGDLGTRQLIGRAISVLIKQGMSRTEAIARAKELGVRGCEQLLRY